MFRLFTTVLFALLAIATLVAAIPPLKPGMAVPPNRPVFPAKFRIRGTYSSSSDQSSHSEEATIPPKVGKCTNTKDLVSCRDHCFTIYGPYSSFYPDCQACCRKVCEPTAYCETQHMGLVGSKMPSRGYHGYVDKSEAQLNSHASNNAIPEEFKVQTVEENGDESMGKKHQEGIKGGRRRTGFWATLAKYGWH